MLETNSNSLYHRMQDYIDQEMEKLYSQKTIDYFKNPVNVGRMENLVSSAEDLPPDETIDDTSLDLDFARPLPPPPVPPVDAVIIFVPYDEPPAPIGGFAAIRYNLIYPEIAEKQESMALKFYISGLLKKEM